VYDRLVGALYLLTGSYPEAEDMAQEALARVYSQWDRVSRMVSPIGYAYRVAFNLNHRRLSRLGGLLRLLPLLAGPPADPILVSEERADVLRALLALPARQREVLVATEWLGFSTEETAVLLRIAPSSVRATVARARDGVRQRLGEVYE
jgi:RNA polymerase sigma factor (sigma-70 family)